MIVGGAKPVSSVRTCAPIACPDSLTPLISALIRCSRVTGSASPTGSGAHIAATRLPSAPRSTSARTETGTIARSTVSSVGSPRRRRYRPSAPATAASTTSLTVPPSAFLTALNCCRSPRTQVNLRCGPIRTLSGLGGAVLQPRPRHRAQAVDGAAELGGDLARAAQRRADAARDLGRARSLVPAARRPAAGRRSAAAAAPARARARARPAPATCRTARSRCRRRRSRRRARDGSWTAARSGRRRAPRRATAPTSDVSDRAPGRRSARTAA